jgi:hypothetical protein
MSFDHSTPLTANNIGIVYGSVSGIVRAHVYCDTDAQLAAYSANLRPGEKMCLVPMADHLAGHDIFHQSIRNSVEADTPGLTAIVLASEAGIVPFLHAVVDPNTLAVTNIIIVDTNIDTDAGAHNWIHHGSREVQIGHTYDLINKVFNIHPVSLPIKPGRPTVTITAASTVPAINPPVSLNLSLGK